MKRLTGQQLWDAVVDGDAAARRRLLETSVESAAALVFAEWQYEEGIEPARLHKYAYGLIDRLAERGLKVVCIADSTAETPSVQKVADLISAAQAVCQSRGGTDPQATAAAHAEAVSLLEKSLARYFGESERLDPNHNPMQRCSICRVKTYLNSSPETDRCAICDLPICPKCSSRELLNEIHTQSGGAVEAISEICEACAVRMLHLFPDWPSRFAYLQQVDYPGVAEYLQKQMSAEPGPGLTKG